MFFNIGILKVLKLTFGPHFDSVDDLKPIFGRGVKVVFSTHKPVASMGSIVDPKNDSIWRGYPYAKEIQIRARVDTFPPSKIYGKVSEADEQTITLIHEFDHLFREFSGNRDGRIQSDHPLEVEIDEHSFYILRNQPEIWEHIVYELSTCKNCSIFYEVPAKTPFYHLHRKLVAKFVRSGSFSSLTFGDSVQVRLLELAKKMNVRTSR